MVFVTAMVVTLVVGDFASTFFYHIPQHLWFTLHLRTHHDRRRSYWDHAVLSTNPADPARRFPGRGPVSGGRRAAARALVAGALWPGWRWGSSTSGGATRPNWAGGAPSLASAVCPWAGIVLPEDHDGHHRNPDIEFGDIFRFYDVPARALHGQACPDEPPRAKRGPAATSEPEACRPGPNGRANDQTGAVLDLGYGRRPPQRG